MTSQTNAVPVPAEGEMTSIDLDGVKVAVAHVNGRLYAFADACTHMQCSLSGGDLEGTTVVCPCHLGRFDVRTGSVLGGPPPEPVRTWPVTDVDGVVQVIR